MLTDLISVLTLLILTPMAHKRDLDSRLGVSLLVSLTCTVLLYIINSSEQGYG